MDAEGNKVTKFNIKHGDDGIYWKNAEGAESTANKAKAKNIAAYQMVKDEIVKRGTITDAELRAWASMTSDIGQNIAIDYAKAWAEDKTCEPRIYRDKREKPIDPKTGKKAKGNSPIVFTTVKPKWLEEYENHQMELEREKACEEMELEFKD